MSRRSFSSSQMDELHSRTKRKRANAILDATTSPNAADFVRSSSAPSGSSLLQISSAVEPGTIPTPRRLSVSSNMSLVMTIPGHSRSVPASPITYSGRERSLSARPSMRHSPGVHSLGNPSHRSPSMSTIAPVSARSILLEELDEEEGDVDVVEERDRAEALADHQGVDLEPGRRNRIQPVIPTSNTVELRRLIREEVNRRRQTTQTINRTVHFAVNQSNRNPNPVYHTPPTAPARHYIVPLTTQQWLTVYDTMLDSQNNRTEGVEAATEQQILQFVTTYQCAWVDKYLKEITSVVEDSLVVQIPDRIGSNEHLLIQHLFPANVTRLIDRNPTVPADGFLHPRDQFGWDSLDDPVPLLKASDYLALPTALDSDEASIPAAITYDVDSVIVYASTLPLSGALEIRAVPNPKSTFRKTNHIATTVDGKRVPLSSIPNFRLGFSSRLSVQLMFPSLYVHSVTPTPMISLENQGLIWDQFVLPAFQAANSTPSNPVGPGIWKWELARHRQLSQTLSYSNNQHLLSSRDIPNFVQAMRNFTQDPQASDFIRSLEGFQFLISLQGSKTWSMIDYNSFVQSELGWMSGILPQIEDGRKYFRQIMAAKAYLKSLRMATRDFFRDDWFDFAAVLEESIAKICRYAAWKAHEESDSDLEEDRLITEEEQRRIRKGPSFVLGELKAMLESNGMAIWADLAVQFFSDNYVTVWDQKCGFALTQILLGDSSFNNTSYSKGLRLDEVAGIPGLGGLHYTNKLTPFNSVNNPIVSLQLYTQEKILTYKAFGNKDHGSQYPGAIPARELPLWLLLDARSSPESRLQDWLQSEVSIFDSANSRQHLAARCEIRADINNLLDAAWNITLAREEINGNRHLVHIDNEEWHRWKGIRAVNFAALPTTIFRLHKSLDPWTIMLAMLTAQGHIHALHARPVDATIERAVSSVNTRHLEVSISSSSSRRVYQETVGPQPLHDRHAGTRYVDWHPAGVRTLYAWFHPTKGLDWRNFRNLMHDQIYEDDMWKRVVRRGVRALTQGPAGLLNKIKRDPAPRSSDRAFPRRRTSAVEQNMLLYKEDIRYDRVLSALDHAKALLQTRKLVINASTTGELFQALRRIDYDPLDVTVKFWQAMNLASVRKDAQDLIVLRDLSRKGRQLEKLSDGRYKLIPLEATIMELDEDDEPGDDGLLQESDRATGTGPVSHFEGYIPPVDDPLDTARSATNHRPELYSSLIYDPVNRLLRIPGCNECPILRQHLVPPAITEEEKADDTAFASTLSRVRASNILASGPSAASQLKDHGATIGDFFFFVADLFQTELLEAIPLESTVGDSKGDQFWLQDLASSDYKMSANVMRESYAGLCGRLSHFTLTHATNAQWEEQAPKWMPLRGEPRPRCWKGDFSYIPIWLRFVERVSRLGNVDGIQDALYKARNHFIHTFHLLPYHHGGKYAPKAFGHCYTAWDQTPHDNQAPNPNSTSKVAVPPRWYTVHRGGRKNIARIRLMYNFTHRQQAPCWGYFKTPGDIQETGGSRPQHKTYPSPPPFEICWLWHHSSRVLHEKTYVMQREQEQGYYYPSTTRIAARYQPLCHDWWSENDFPAGLPHNKLTCTKCILFASLNRGSLDDKSMALEPALFNLGNFCWGHFAACP